MVPRVVMSLSQQAFAKGRDENNFKKNGQLLFNYFLLSAPCSSEWSRSMKGWTVCFVRDVSLSLLVHNLFIFTVEPHVTTEED